MALVPAGVSGRNLRVGLHQPLGNLSRIVAMVYRVYPIIHFLACFGALLGGIVLVRMVTELSWPLLIVPVPAVLLGCLLSSLVVAVFPRIRFVNNSEIDGLGYVHQPSGAMLLVCLLGFAIAVLQMVR